MSTATTADLNKTIVTRLRASLGATPPIYISQAPDTAAFPYIVVRKINAVSAPEYNNARENFELEIMCFGRPRSSEQVVEGIADTVVASLLTWVESGASPLGLSFGHSYQRDNLPPVGDASDRELVTVRVVVQCSTWPMYLVTPLQA